LTQVERKELTPEPNELKQAKEIMSTVETNKIGFRDTSSYFLISSTAAAAADEL